MKIDPTTKTSPVRRVKGYGAVTRSDAKPTSSVGGADEIVMMGIPERELTPSVRAALKKLIEEVEALRSELKNASHRINDLESLADRDPMLEISNRRAFTRELDRVLSMVERYDISASIVFIDLNDLKKINDNYGHGAGDAALMHVAASLQNTVRQADVVARLGGDEFGVLMMQADQEVAMMKAGVMADKIAEEPILWKGASLPVSVSWGAVQIQKGTTANEAMSKADEEMYKAKRSR